jgi:hypothetical protein
MTVYSSRFSEPTFPAITSPELSPTPMRNPSPCPSLRIHSLNSSSAGPAISHAAAYARSAWSSSSIGAPKTAMIPSPMNATSVPP